jgi:hypothetical protein
MKIYGVIIILTMFSAVLMGQRTQQGSLVIIQDPRIDLLVNRHIELNGNRTGFPGYRIQIFFDSGSNSKIRAQSVYEEFAGKFPEVKAYLLFIAPNYKVRVGDFRTRLDATRLLREIQADYPNAYVITDEINFPDIN